MLVSIVRETVNPSTLFLFLSFFLGLYILVITESFELQEPPPRGFLSSEFACFPSYTLCSLITRLEILR
jgi:hypothetical protein